jgi:hypothetical protein
VAAVDEAELSLSAAGRARTALRSAAADPAVRTAASLWLASRVLVVALAWAASWVMRPSGAGGAPLAGAWEHWDAVQFRTIAQYGYFAPGHSQPHAVAFFPGLPLLLRAAHLVIPSWTGAELAVASVASFFAILGLIRLADDELAGSGPWAAAFLVAAPAAVFLAVGYSEALFLAVALPAWLAGRRGHWTRAGLFAAAACAVRVNGLFLLAGLVIMAIRARARPGAAAWLAVALAPVAGYTAYTGYATGDWLAWVHAERAGWGRFFGNPVRTFTSTWQAAFGPEFHPPLAFMFQLELAAAVVIAILLVALASRRRWPETAYVALTAAALGLGTWYESVPRALLLVFPLWVGLGAAARRHWPAGAIWLAATIPLMCVTALLYLSGGWAG